MFSKFLFGLLLLFGFLFVPLSVQAAHAFQISGTVTDQNGNGVPNVSVTATAPGDTTVVFGPSQTATGGSYLLDVDAGTFDIHFTPANGSGYTPLVQSNV